jgi:hypothetical protein
MKIKQISIALTFAVCISSITLFMQSCSSDEDYDAIFPTLTKADMLVASHEFQEFQENMEIFAENLRINYFNLSESDRNEFNEILKNLVDKNTDDVKELYEQANSIIGIDIELELNKIGSNSFKRMNSADINDVSRKDLITAMKKQGFVNENTTIRLKSGNEKDPEQLQKCKDSCSASYIACCVAAAFTPPPGDVLVFAACTTAYLFCLNAC